MSKTCVKTIRGKYSFVSGSPIIQQSLNASFSAQQKQAQNLSTFYTLISHGRSGQR